MRKKQQVQTTGEALEKPESQIRVMWDTLKKNKAAVAGLVVIVFFLFLAVMGDWLAPYDPEFLTWGTHLWHPARITISVQISLDVISFHVCFQVLRFPFL